MSDHAKLSPSSASRWMACPGSVARCAGFSDEGNIYADEGTFAHEVAAECLELDADITEKVGVESSCGRFTLTEEMAQHVDLYLRAVRATRTIYGGDLEIEKRVSVIPGLLWGTSDALIWRDDELDVFDLKFGSGVFVDVRNNKQAMLYGVGALRSNPEKAKTVGRVRIHIVQPRHSADPKWRSQEFSHRELMDWCHDVVTPAVQATSEKNAPLIPGDEQCKWCPAKAQCPELRSTVMTKAQHVFAEPRQSPPHPDEMTPVQVSEALRVFPLIEEWMKAVRAHAYELADRHHIDVPGYKLVRKRANRKWRDEATAAMELARLGVDPHQQKIITPAEAERRIGRSGKTVVATLAHVPDAGTTLASEDDPRPAVSRGAAFSVLTTDDKESTDE